MAKINVNKGLAIIKQNWNPLLIFWAKLMEGI